MRRRLTGRIGKLIRSHTCSKQLEAIRVQAHNNEHGQNKITRDSRLHKVQ